MDKNISIVIPVYNEAPGVLNVITSLKNELASLGLNNYEIIAVNDASKDNSKNILESIFGIKIINQPYNKGYGACLKTGARQAKYDWLLFFDADGQHQPEYIREMLKYTDEYDLIAGERVGYQGPWLRQPGKKFIHWLAFYLLGQKVKDFNCGLRLIKKKEFLRFAHILPDGFSCSTTTIFAFLKEKLNLKFVPVKINKRQGGKSLIRPKEAIIYLMLILRLIMLFSPLRIFFPVSLILVLFGLGYLIYDLFWMFNVSEGTIFILITSILVFFFGLMADQISALRREINKR